MGKIEKGTIEGWGQKTHARASLSEMRMGLVAQ
jgi:hypothetical protein